jgi:bacillithiol biosynthesis deacetylase BshB1
MKLDVLAIGAHPDDIELSCSATLVKLIAQGKSVGILDLTDGELGTRGSRSLRLKEALTASKILGIQSRIRLGLHDGNIEVTQPNIRKVMQVIRHYQPTVLLFPHWLERHPDHEHAHRLCREAWFYSGLEKIATTYQGKKQQPYRPKKYFHFMQKYEFQPTFIVDVSDVYETKQRSLTAFASQFYNPKSTERETILSSKLFLESVYARDRHFGSMINVAYGEPFFSVEPLGFSTFFDILM